MLDQEDHNKMYFQLYRPNTRLVDNRYGIAEPGLAHECQKVSFIPVADWDVPMKGVATEKQLYR